MENEEIKKMINEYFDGELNKEKESFLFTSLSQNEEERKYFKGAVFLDKNSKNNLQKAPERIDKKIFSEIYTRKASYRNRILVKVSCAVSIISLFIAIYLFTEVKNSQSLINKYSAELANQSNKIEVLYSYIPPIIVYAKHKNEIINKGEKL